MLGEYIFYTWHTTVILKSWIAAAFLIGSEDNF